MLSSTQVKIKTNDGHVHTVRKATNNEPSIKEGIVLLKEDGSIVNALPNIPNPLSTPDAVYRRVKKERITLRSILQSTQEKFGAINVAPSKYWSFV